MIIKHISRFTDNDCVEVIKSLIFTFISLFELYYWASRIGILPLEFMVINGRLLLRMKLKIKQSMQ